MTTQATEGYQPSDTLSLWFLASPTTPVLVGALQLVHSGGVSLRYDPSWIARGFALSEDLPLQPQEFFSPSKDTAPGAIDDARPDRWGERVIRLIDRPRRLALLDYLYFAGDDRFGALGVSTSPDNYLPRRLGPLPTLADTQAVYELVQKVLANEPVQEREKRLIASGGTMGGAKPKALIEIDGHQWVLKFDDGGPLDTPLIEHATMLLAGKAGICVAETKALRLVGGHAVAVKRFDRTNTARRHALSAHVALRAAGSELGYPELAQLLRRRGVVAYGTFDAQRSELFRRMVFNILIDNTDDHEKNHALLMTDAFEYELAPAYDVLPSGQAIGYQQMRVGAAGAESTITNALSMCSMFGLKKAQALTEVARVVRVVDLWKEHFADCGVTPGDIDLCREQIDRPFLLEQRQAFGQ